jgi:hypothetical protein
MDEQVESFIVDEPAPRHVRGLGVALLAGMAAAAVLLLTATPSAGPVTAVVTVLALLLGAAAGVLLLVCRITVSVGADTVVVAFPPVYRRRLAPGDIDAVRDLPRVTPSMFGGSGLRFASGNRVALLFRAGPATEITTRSGRSYTVVLRESEALTVAVGRLLERES